MSTPLSASPMFNAKGHYKPFVYPWAFNAYREQSNAHWPATEVPLQEDVRDWNTKLSVAEKNLLTQIFRFFTQGDVDIGNAYVDRYIPVFKNEEVRGMMTTFASIEVVHADAYNLLLETIGMPEAEHKAFMKYEAMAAKHDYYDKFGPITCIEDAIRNIAVFSMFTEGMQLFSSFAILLNFTRHNRMNRMGQIVTLSIRDENLHCQFMTQVFRQLVAEFPKLLTDQLKGEIYQIAEEMVTLEDGFIDLAFEQGGIEGLTPKEVKHYARFMANQRLGAAGLKKIFNGYYTNSIPWIEDLLTLKTQVSFFENKSVDYASGNVMGGSWSDVFPEEHHKADTVHGGGRHLAVVGGSDKSVRPPTLAPNVVNLNGLPMTIAGLGDQSEFPSTAVAGLLSQAG